MRIINLRSRPQISCIRQDSAAGTAVSATNSVSLRILGEEVNSRMGDANCKFKFENGIYNCKTVTSNYRLQFPKSPTPQSPPRWRGEERQSGTDSEWRSQEGVCPTRKKRYNWVLQKPPSRGRCHEVTKGVIGSKFI